MSRTRTITLTLGSVAAGAILATGVTGLALADDSATPSPSTSSSAPGSDTAPGIGGQRGPGDGMRDGRGGMHGMRGGPMGEALHGELVVKAADGTISTVRQVQGTVTAVTSTSITVKAEDGYTATFAVNADTEVHTGLPSRDRGTADDHAVDRRRLGRRRGPRPRHRVGRHRHGGAPARHDRGAGRHARGRASAAHAGARGRERHRLVQRDAGQLAGRRVGGPRRCDLVERPLDGRSPSGRGPPTPASRSRAAPSGRAARAGGRSRPRDRGRPPACGACSASGRSRPPPAPRGCRCRPGRARKASERSSMIPFRWRMSRVTMNSSESWSATSMATRASGMTPIGVTAGRPRGAADLAHHRDGPGPRHQPPAPLGDPRPGLAGEVQVALVDREAGGAEDADRGHAPTLDAGPDLRSRRIWLYIQLHTLSIQLPHTSQEQT